MMKHFIFCIFTLFACVNSVQAQVTISTSDLNGTKWQTPYQYDNQATGYEEFTSCTSVEHLENGRVIVYPYYLSDTIVTKFDYTKIGKSTKGHYLIELNTKLEIVYCSSIKEFDKQNGSMTLEGEGTGHYVLIPSNKPRNQSEKYSSSADDW